MSQSKLRNVKRILLIVLSVIALSIAFYFFQLWSYSSENERSASFFERSIVASINQYEYLPALLAKDDLVINLLENPIQNHEVLSDKLNFTTKRSKASDIFLLDKMGKVVSTSNFKSPEKSFFGQNYSFRPYFKKAFEEKKRQYYFAKGVTTGIPGFFISTPVIKNDQVLGVMVVKLYLSEWENSWSDSNDNVLVADANGIIVLSSDDQWRYKTIGQLPKDKLEAIYATKQFPKETHSSVYSNQYSYTFGLKEVEFWKIGRTRFVVSHFKIENTQWTFYHLVKHGRFLTHLLLFFFLLSLLGLALHFFLNERTHKLALKHIAREGEKKRHHERQALIDNIHIGIIVFTKNGRVLSMNDHALELLVANKKSSFEAYDFDKITINDLLSLELTHENIEAFIDNDAIAVNAYNETTAKITNPDNEHYQKTPIIFSIANIHYADRDAYVMTVIDITRRKKVEDQLIHLNESLEEKVSSRTQELKDIQAALIQKNKTVALGNMAATIVHELSQPLSAMNSSVGALLLKMENENWQGAGESAQRLLPLSNKMRNVINLLKFFSYQDENIEEEVALDSLINQSVDVLKDNLREKNIHLENKLNGDLVLIKANPVKLDLVISNLLKNAMDAVEDVENPHIIIDSIINDDELTLYIEDNGTGVDEHIMGQLFNPYFTTKEVGKGMGLGLSITYEIIKQYGGDISAENTSQGAKFSITLPLHT